MDSIVTIALVGTGRQNQVNVATGTPVDGLIEGLTTGEDERKLLLSAGARAIYRQAGQKAQQMASLPEPAAPETLRPCAPASSLLLSRLLGGEQGELLPEALERVRQVGAHLPYDLLPTVLNRTGKGLHAAIFPVLGARGLWLSRFNSSWDWVRDFLPVGESGLPADAETIWQEGTTAQRVEILSRLRAADPAKAREWLEDCWKKERAEVRVDLLTTLEHGLSAEDEPFLEKALDDRALSVRTLAASLLPHLPDSAYVARMIARGGALLRMKQDMLDVVLPTKFDSGWTRDGIVEGPPNKLGKRAWWLVQILALMPPAFWETQFGKQPAELLQLLGENQWATNVIDGWSRAALTYRASAWFEPLWNWWQEHYDHLKGEHLTDYTIRETLLKSLSQEAAEQVILAMLAMQEEAGAKGDWGTFLLELPKPWSETFSFTFLRALRAHCEPLVNLQSDTKNFSPYTDPWFSTLSVVALALPAVCLSEAAQSWDFSQELTDWQVKYARQELQQFVETIQMRQRIYEEIVSL